MKRFVRYDWAAPVIGAFVCLAIVALTGAGAGATYLIALGISVIMMAIRLGPERVQLWREKRGS